MRRDTAEYLNDELVKERRLKEEAYKFIDDLESYVNSAVSSSFSMRVGVLERFAAWRVKHPQIKIDNTPSSN